MVVAAAAISAGLKFQKQFLQYRDEKNSKKILILDFDVIVQLFVDIFVIVLFFPF